MTLKVPCEGIYDTILSGVYFDCKVDIFDKCLDSLDRGAIWSCLSSKSDSLNDRCSQKVFYVV